ncbi:MAG TPA: polysaccharide biosynthesis/export family protein, partial [Pedobacter sp.]
MNNIYTKNNIFCLLALCGAFLLSSCGTPKNVVYFSDLDSAKVRQIPNAVFVEPLIQTDDLLSITIQTLDFSTLSAVSQTSASTAASSPQLPAPITGFLVDKDGNVEIPIVGIVKVAGLTTSKAKEVIRAQASRYYKDPTIQVRFANYKITVLGEVLRPASYTMPNEKVTVLDAISMAGDLTILGKRENVLLMRDNGDKKEVVRLDLTSSKVFASPYFYLKQN